MGFWEKIDIMEKEWTREETNLDNL